MTYLTKLSPHQLSIIGPSIQALEHLTPGQEIKVKFATAQFTERVRYWVYSYLHINNLKDIYTLKRRSQTSFAIQRKEEEECVLEIPPLNQAENFVVECLLDVTSEAEAITCITKSDLDSEAQIYALAEWKRINS